jgi:hypothetical protein
MARVTIRRLARPNCLIDIFMLLDQLLRVYHHKAYRLYRREREKTPFEEPMAVTRSPSSIFFFCLTVKAKDAVQLSMCPVQRLGW